MIIIWVVAVVVEADDSKLAIQEFMLVLYKNGNYIRCIDIRIILMYTILILMDIIF